MYPKKMNVFSKPCTVTVYPTGFVLLYFCITTRQNTKHCFVGQKEYFVVHFTALPCPGEDETPVFRGSEYLSCQLRWNCQHCKGWMGATPSFSRQHWWIICKHTVAISTDIVTRNQSTESPGISDKRIQNQGKKEASPHMTLWHSTLNTWTFLRWERGFLYFMKEEICQPSCALVSQDRIKTPLSCWTAREKRA